MSTYFIPDGPLAFESLREFDHSGVHAAPADSDGSVVLTDGHENYIRAYPATPNDPVTFERSGANDPDRIIAALESAFHINLVSEYDEEYELLQEQHRTPRR